MHRTLNLKTQAPQNLDDLTERCGTYTRRKVAWGLSVVALLAVVSAARADNVSISELTQAQFATIFGSVAPNFNGIALPMGGVLNEPAGLMVGSLLFGDTGNGNLAVVGPGLGADIGTSPDKLLVEDDGTGANNINITFAKAVAIVGLIAGDGLTGGGGDTAVFNVTFGDSSFINGIGLSAPLLPITGGNTPTYFALTDSGGHGISQVNFADTAGFPSLDTVTSAPEPNSVWLLAVPILALGIGSVMRKRKTAAARLGSGAAPLALLAVLAILAVPSSSFAQVNCNLAVPNSPLTAAGLATPYILSPGDANCSQSAATMAFVQAAIYDPAAHTISVYTPLVSDPPSGTPLKKPRYVISPVVPNLPANAVVAIWFGYNANNLTLTGTGVTTGNCFTNFGQYAACNTTAFWTAVNADNTLLANIWNAFKGQTGSDGQACPTSRSFSIVDQDPTDNLPVSFLLTTEAQPRTAQDTVANRAKFVTMFGPLGTGWNVQINPSDEVVVDKFIDGALGCNPPVVADLTDPGTTRASLAVNELFAGLQSGQFPLINSGSIYGTGPNQLRGPGLVAIGDTFTLVPTFAQPNGVATCVTTPTTGECTYPYTGGDIGAFDAYVAAMGYAQTNPQTISGTLSTGSGTAFARTNQYRASTNQPLATVGSTTSQDGTTADASVQTFCTKLYTRTGVGDNSPADLLFNKDYTAFNQAGNGPGGSDLFMFLGNRFGASYDLLGCEAVFGKSNPVNVTNINNTVVGGPLVLSYYPVVFP